ncbi:hypothetical protein STHU_36640 [Allostella humosa]|nr:hypothetical protein [Stella humosa]BBK33030.1 hypothetical protein STHU_36640 [Stella humosa]
MAAAAIAALGVLAAAAPSHAQQFGMTFYNDSGQQIRVHVPNVYLGTIDIASQWDYTVQIGNGNMYYNPQFLDMNNNEICGWTVNSEYRSVYYRTCQHSGKNGDKNSSDTLSCNLEYQKHYDGTCEFTMTIKKN